MALQTNVFRNGQWVTETLDLQAVLKANATPASKPARQRASQPPGYGILTRTVIESPVAHWILPVRLRSAQHMDVAIIGDQYVQICELGRDGRLHDILRKTDFGSRIRNAKVIGLPPEHARGDGDDDDHVDIKQEDEAVFDSDDGDGPVGPQGQASRSGGSAGVGVEAASDDVPMSGTAGPAPAPDAGHEPGQPGGAPYPLPPQQLLLVLESGDCLFLHIRPGASPNRFEFVPTHYEPRGRRIVQPGFHAAVDPSSRYMALACAENFFVVYELESARQLNQDHARGVSPRPIRNFRPRGVHGIIHKMEFLFPYPHDDYHIILLLIIVRDGAARMVTYEWEAGDDLYAVFKDEKIGQPLPPHHQMPLMIIPLTLHAAFFAISDGHIGVCRDALNLPAEFDDFALEVQETSRFHHGHSTPLWSAWTRPYRLPTYNTTRDSIYLAREDGVVIFLDIDADNILGASVEIGQFDCNIGTSFCSLFDDFNDILIMGGDSGPGTIWQIRPRQPNLKLGTIPNWSPVIDMVTSDEFTTINNRVGAKGKRLVPWQDRPAGAFATPDRIFATAGRGVTGSITEFRYGLRASIGLDIDYEMPVKQSWIFASRNETSDLVYHLLMSLVDTSVALYLSADMTQANQFDDEAALYDVTSRTVAAAQLSDDVIVQVTERRIVFVSARQSSSLQHLHSVTFQEPQVAVVDACISGDLVAVSSHLGSQFQLHLLQLRADGIVAVLGTYAQTGDVTCLFLDLVQGEPCIVAGLLHEGVPSLVLYRFNASANNAPLVISLSRDALSQVPSSLPSSLSQTAASQTASAFEALSSVALLPQKYNRGDKSSTLAIVFGTRGGDVGALTLDAFGRPIAVNADKAGRTVARISLVDDPQLGKAVLVVCDGRVSLQSRFDAKKAAFRSMHSVWLVDAADTSKLSPLVNAATTLCGELPGRRDKSQLLFTSASRVMLAELHAQPGPVQRSIPTKGTPLKVLYSHPLECLVVALRDLNGRSTLQFLNPDTGEDLSMPTTRDGEPVEYVSGLGKLTDHILGLSEWIYRRNGDKWVFLLVATREGRFLVLSTGRSSSARTEGGLPRVTYWTRHKRSLLEPVYSLVADGHNVFYCSGTTVYWDTLELSSRRLHTVGTIDLPSFALTLRVIHGKLVAVTDRDSLEIIHLDAINRAMTLHHGDSESRTAAFAIEMGGRAGGGSGSSSGSSSGNGSGSGADGGGTGAGPVTGSSAGPHGNEEPESDASLLLVSDRNAMVAGLWVPWWQPGKSCTVVFDAELPASVRKLVRGRTRPRWQQVRRDIRYGLVPSTPDAAEMFGVCLDGSLHHFTLLGPLVARILRLVQRLALMSPILFPFTWQDTGSAGNSHNGSHNGSRNGNHVVVDDDDDDDDDDDPLYGLGAQPVTNGRASVRGRMQVDGDMLKRCLDQEALEQLFAQKAHRGRLFAMLDELDGGRWTAAFRGAGDDSDDGDDRSAAGAAERAEQYFALLYDILEYYLEPVL